VFKKTSFKLKGRVKLTAVSMSFLELNQTKTDSSHSNDSKRQFFGKGVKPGSSWRGIFSPPEYHSPRTDRQGVSFERKEEEQQQTKER
jgi:hypothetical protein